MRFALLTCALALLCTPAFASAAGIPEDLRKADYITAVDVEAEVPHGELFIDEAVIAIFPRLEDRLSGMLIGRARLKLRAPRAAGEAGLHHGVTQFKVARAYLSTAPSADIKILPKGRALAARRWDDLSDEEQQEFLSIYNAALPDGWNRQTATAHGVPRDPRGKEFFTAFWVEQSRVRDTEGETPADVRYDFRVDAEGDELSFTDRNSETVLFQLPAAAAATAAPSDTSP